jgi:hypothetical protein
MPSDDYQDGDPCFCDIIICNPGLETFFQTPLFALLEVNGIFYFAPAFTESVNFLLLDIQPGITVQNVLAQFNWPQNAGNGSAIFYSAMTDPEVTRLSGSMDVFEFGWSE